MARDKRKVWTQEEIEFLKEQYPNSCSKELASQMDITYMMLWRKASQLGLKKSDVFLRQTRDRVNQNLLLGKRFEKGNQSHNKGKKMSPEVYEKVKQFFFIKGHKPHNERMDGHEHITHNGYVRIKHKGSLVLKQRVVYEENHGPIPEGMVVTFLDGNRQNFEIENLALITMAENANRNQIHHYPEELKSVIKTLNKLKKKINEKQV